MDAEKVKKDILIKLGFKKNNLCGNDYISACKQIDNFLEVIQNNNRLQWLPINNYTDKDIARWGADFIKRKSSDREFISNLNKDDYNKICTSLQQKLDELNPSVSDYRYNVKYFENIKKIMTCSPNEILSIQQKECYNFFANINILNIEKILDDVKSLFKRCTVPYIDIYDRSAKSQVLYDDTFSLNFLIDFAVSLFAQIIEMVTFFLKTEGKYPVLFLDKIEDEIKGIASQYRNCVQQYYNTVTSEDKIRKSDFFLRQTFSRFAGYLNREKENALSADIDNVLINEQYKKLQLFVSSGYFFDYETANSMGVKYFTEGLDIKDTEKKLLNANELIKKFIGEKNINYFYQKIFFREAYIVDTAFKGKKRYTSDIVRKLLNDIELSQEERIFFSHKVHRGKFREFDVFYCYEAYTRSISEVSKLYLEVFQWIDFKKCVQQIDFVFSILIDLVLSAYKEQIKTKKCK